MDPAADAAVDTRPLRPNAQVAVIPNGVLATDKDRVAIETAARTSAEAKRVNLVTNVGFAGTSGIASGGLITVPLRADLATAHVKPVTAAERAHALRTVDEALVEAEVIDEVGGNLSARLQAELSFERTTCLPTQAIVIKGCLDECSVCEPALERSIELDLVRKGLENDLLAKQIELLEKSQQYRCCPAGEVEDDAEDDD